MLFSNAVMVGSNIMKHPKIFIFFSLLTMLVLSACRKPVAEGQQNKQ